jgi:hypothetical protein
MAITTANTAAYTDLNALLHEYYAIGKHITDLCTLQGISNTVMNGVCSEIKGVRQTTNATHVAVLVQLGGN